jgi:hypothetical protein
MVEDGEKVHTPCASGNDRALGQRGLGFSRQRFRNACRSGYGFIACDLHLATSGALHLLHYHLAEICPTSMAPQRPNMTHGCSREDMV